MRQHIFVEVKPEWVLPAMMIIIITVYHKTTLQSILIPSTGTKTISVVGGNNYEVVETAVPPL